MIEANITYWVYIAITLLTMCNIYFVGRHWQDVVENWDDEKSGFRTVLAPGILTAMVFGTIGMISLGYTGNAKAQNTALEGTTQHATIQALETEARDREQVITRTRSELESLRRENANLKAEAERKAFEQNVRRGQDDMLSTRERLMNREKEK